MPERWIEKSNIKYQHFFALIMGGGLSIMRGHGSFLWADGSGCISADYASEQARIRLHLCLRLP